MLKINLFVVVFLLLSVLGNGAAFSASAQESGKGKFYADFRLRYESVEQNNPLPDADALTLRSRIGYKTPELNGFSALLEIEDTREIVDDFSVPPAGVRPGEFSVIADPETTEVDQAFLQYSHQGVIAKIGRQVIALDGQRFVGHVGWRQDRQTFDAAMLTYKPNKQLALTAAYIDKRNRIFADEADIDSKDVILNASYQTPYGKLVSYAYLLEVDNDTSNSLDTYGVSFKGKKPINDVEVLYTAEYASQEINDEFDTDYIFVEGGVVINGVTAKIGYEILGSDDGNKGFATPLATLHKFNGWSDQFLATPDQGLKDLMVTLSGKMAGGKWVAAYHDFSADESLEGQDDLGSELNLLYARPINKRFSAGIKYADYSAGDAAFSKVDTEKVWLWLNAKF